MPVFAPWIHFLPCIFSLLLEAGPPSGFQVQGGSGRDEGERRETLGVCALPPLYRLAVTPCQWPRHLSIRPPSPGSGDSSGLCQLLLLPAPPLFPPVPVPPSAGLFTTSAQLCKSSLFETFPQLLLWVFCLSGTLTYR